MLGCNIKISHLVLSDLTSRCTLQHSFSAVTTTAFPFQKWHAHVLSCNEMVPAYLRRQYQSTRLSLSADARHAFFPYSHGAAAK